MVSVPERPLSAGLTRRIALSGHAEDGSSGSGRFLAGLWAVCHPALHPMWHFALVPAERLAGLVPSSRCETLPGERARWPSGRGDPCRPASLLCSGVLWVCSRLPLFGEKRSALGSSGQSSGTPPSGEPPAPRFGSLLPLCPGPVPLLSWTELLEVQALYIHDGTSRVQHGPALARCVFHE